MGYVHFSLSCLRKFCTYFLYVDCTVSGFCEIWKRPRLFVCLHMKIKIRNHFGFFVRKHPCTTCVWHFLQMRKTKEYEDIL